MKVNLGEVDVRKTKDELNDKDWIILDKLFFQKDIARMFGIPSTTSAVKIRKALKRYSELENPVEQGKQFLLAMDEIIEKGKSLQQAGVDNQLPELGFLAQVSVWTILDVLRDKHTSRQDKLRGASELRKFLETGMTIRETFLKSEAINKIVEVLKDIIGQLSPPLQEEFAKRIFQDEKLRFLLKGF